MKKVFLAMLSVFLFGSCVTDDGFCNCTPPPGGEEALSVFIKDKNGNNLLFADAPESIDDEQLTFYLLTEEKKINLTYSQKNSSIIEEYLSEDGEIIKYIHLGFSWYMKNNNGIKDGSYIIDYNGLYPNDTIYTKYKATEWKEEDILLEVKLNGELVQPDSVAYLLKRIDIVK